MTQENLCPCGTGKNYDQCCGPFIDGKALPLTAEALMRSRYSAYARQDDDYLLQTWHPDTRPKYKPTDDDVTTWTKLEIIRTEAGNEGDTQGVVEFIAHCDIKGTAAQLHETSQFMHDGERWYYVDGKGQEPKRRDNPKVGRNDPCPCGSGKKFKKCCGR